MVKITGARKAVPIQELAVIAWQDSLPEPTCNAIERLTRGGSHQEECAWQQAQVGRMIDPRIFQEFSDRVWAAPDEVAFARAASKLAEAVGYRWFTYLSIAGNKPAGISTYPAIWSDHYLANAFDQVDPVVAAAHQQYDPFFWEIDIHTRPEDAVAQRFFDDATSFGIVHGVTVPLRDSRKPIALFTLATDQISPAHKKNAQELKTLAQVSGLHLHNQISSRVGRFMPVNRQALTSRQRAVLAAASKGQSAKQAARVIGLTPRTVQYHLEEAKRRLDAESLPHAIALAFRRGLIS